MRNSELRTQITASEYLPLTTLDPAKIRDWKGISVEMEFERSSIDAV
jgi:hypothetical protein